MKLRIRGITDDSRKVKPGYLYIAIKGSRYDGHDYLQEAAKKGAVAAVSEIQNHSPYLPMFHVKNVRKFFATVLNHFYDRPSAKLKLFGVTGTNGKTTTAFMIERIFRENSKKTGLIGTVLVRVGEKERRATLTTPSAGELQETFVEMLEAGVEYAVMEVSSQGLVQHRVDGLEFAGGVVTNLGLDHLDCHKSFDEYLAAKERFYQMLEVGKPLFLNGDDREVMKLAEGTKATCFTYGRQKNLDFRAENIQLTPEGSRFDVVFHDQRIAMQLQVLGIHNIYNALAAIAVGLYAQIDIAVIQSALAQFACVERRMEVFHLDEVMVVDDTALNPGSIDAVFSYIKELDYHHLIVVNAIRGRRSAAVNRENAKALAFWASEFHLHELIITSSIEAVEEADHVLPEEQQAFCDVLDQVGLLCYFSRLDEAIDYAIKQLQKGDILLLLGAQGMDTGAQLVRRKYPLLA